MNIDEAKLILKDVEYPQYTFIAIVDGRGEMYLQAFYYEPDIYTGNVEKQFTRRWFISPEMSKSELVQTALKCILTSAEHRVREHFKYREALVYGPHINIDKLWEVTTKNKPDTRKLKNVE